MKLLIQLLSDLCVSSGESYNSYIDIEAVYDDYGFPFIPAKRLKGCIREAALELVEWGQYDKSVYERLFGKEKDVSSLFTLDNAYPKNYAQMIAEINDCPDKELVHPQRVLDLYSYTRTQTSLSADGVVAKGSLRNMRVINKGLIFEAELMERVPLSEEQQSLLQDAVAMVKHIGTGRTRGLGLVSLELQEKSADIFVQERPAVSYGDWNKIRYTITLKAPLLCKSSGNVQGKTHDYIEGGKIIGLLAENLSKSEFMQLMRYDSEGGIVASNAYISREGVRFTPIKASLQQKKDAEFNCDGEMVVQDMLITPDDTEQRVPFGHCYVDAGGYVKKVDTEINYHHRRPDNKAIGMATGADNSAFYQLESIRKGQQFSGYILADRQQAPIVEKALLKAGRSRMGYGRNAEYGNVEVVITEVETTCTREEVKTDSFVVKLNSAAILYNEFGCPSADVACLKEYIADALGLDKEELTADAMFLNYETVGGFNVTWGRRKPVYTVLGKGTVCSFSVKRCVDISKLNGMFIGERISEGYGELEISTRVQPDVMLRKQSTNVSEMAVAVSTGILSELAELKNKADAHEAGIQAAIEYVKEHKKLIAGEEINAVLGKLMLIVRDEPTLKAMQEQVNGIESISKRKTASSILRSAAHLETEELAKCFLKGFLYHIKYVVYARKGEQR